MANQLLDRSSRTGSTGPRFSQTLHGRGVPRQDGSCGLGFDEFQTTISAGNDEVYFKPLLIAKEVKLTPPSRIQLSFDNFSGDEAFKQGPKKRRLFKLSLGLDS